MLTNINNNFILNWWNSRFFYYSVTLSILLFNVSTTTFGQELANQDIKINQKRISLADVIHEIENQSSFVFTYSPSILSSGKVIELKQAQWKLNELIEEVSQIAALDFTRVNYNISIKRSKSATPKVSLSESNTKAITGVVLDAGSKDFLYGATIRIENTSQGVITDENGYFKLTIPTQTEYLTIQYLGYEDYIQSVGNQSTFEILLKEASESLDEVMVIGYGTQKKADLTSAISKVDIAKVDRVGFSGTDQLLQGRVAGVQLSAVSGNPGGQQRINIRGVSSLSGQNRPLIVLDGVPLFTEDPSLTTLNKFGEANETSPLSLINPNDIASIEVLKDASASAIYGSRATNGVIIITSKKGTDDQTKFSVNAYTGIQTMPETIQTTGTDQYLAVRNEANSNFNADQGLVAGDVGFLLPVIDPRTPGQEDTDWISFIARDYAKISDVSLSISGGNEKMDVYTSLGYFDQEGIIRTSRFRRFTTTFNLGFKINESLKIQNNLNASYSLNNRVVSHGGINLLQGAIRQRPFDTPYDEDGNYNEAGTGSLVTNNGVQGINESDSDYRSYRIIDNFSIDYALPIKGLSFKSSVGIDFGVYHDQLFWTKEFLYAQNDEGQFTDSRNISLRTLVNNQLSYHGSLGDFNYNLTTIYAWEHFRIDRSYLEGIGFPFDARGSIGTATEVRRTSFRLDNPTDGNNIGENAIESYIGRALINYKSRYYLNLALRIDGSSQFSEGNKYGHFPSASLGWRILDEAFFPSISLFNDLKLRASWGKTGNVSGIGDYSSLPIATSGFTYAEQEGASVIQVGNDQLTWENTTQTDVGIDLALLENRLQVHFDYFYKVTNQLLINRPVPSTTGFTELLQNLGELSNRGWEVELFCSPINRKNFNWTLDFNITRIKNEVLMLPDGEDINPNFANIIREGEALPSFYLLKQIGIYQTNEEVPTSLFEQGVRAGDAIYEDFDGDGNIDDNDRQIVGKAFPDYYGGITNTIKYKSFDLTVFANFSIGNELFLNPRNGGSDLSGTTNFSVDVVNDRWTGEGTSNTTPRAVAFDDWNYQNSTRFLESGSFLRIKTITLGYNFQSQPDKFFSKLRVYASVLNAFTFTEYTGFNPEASDFLETETFGLDEFNSPPALRTYTFGINLNF